MPFTVSHPAAVLPLKKLWPRWFSLSGLMAGAMAPDLQYFLLADTTHRGVSHSWIGLFTVCLPLGVIFAFVFHRLFKRTFIANLPRPFDGALSGLAETRFAPGSVREWVVLVGSVLIGAVSHFAWDSFTHAHGEMAQRLPFLLHETTIFGITRMRVRWLQHLSTIVGGLALLYFTWRWKLLPEPLTRESWRRPMEKLRFWIIAGAVGTIYAVGAVWLYDYVYDWHVMLGHNLVPAVSTFGLGGWAGAFYAVCVYGLVKRRQSEVGRVLTNRSEAKVRTNPTSCP
jgi:hypothetical protein